MIDEVVAEYLKIYPEDAERLSLLKKQLKAGEKLNDRRNFRGHIAGDAIILSPDLKKVLLIYHLRSDRWQQPGGHWDPGEEGPWSTAKREAIEETGVTIERRVNTTDNKRVPLQIITGPVYPSTSKKEVHHWHHDFRYGFIAASDKLGKIQDEGIRAAKWVSIDDTFHADLAEAISRLQDLL